MAFIADRVADQTTVRGSDAALGGGGWSSLAGDRERRRLTTGRDGAPIVCSCPDRRPAAGPAGVDADRPGRGPVASDGRPLNSGGGFRGWSASRIIPEGSGVRYRPSNCMAIPDVGGARRTFRRAAHAWGIGRYLGKAGVANDLGDEPEVSPRMPGPPWPGGGRGRRQSRQVAARRPRGLGGASSTTRR